MSFSEVGYETIINWTTRDRLDVTLVIDPLLCDTVMVCLIDVFYACICTWT